MFKIFKLLAVTFLIVGCSGHDKKIDQTSQEEKEVHVEIQAPDSAASHEDKANKAHVKNHKSHHKAHHSVKKKGSDIETDVSRNAVSHVEIIGKAAASNSDSVTSAIK